MVNERRATEMAAYLLSKDKYGEMHYKKLMGLMYLSDRKCMKRYYEFMSEDYFEAKEHGPVLSETYQLMEGKCISSVEILEDASIDGPFDIWGSKINKLDDDNYISVKEKLTVDDINRFILSDEDCEIMDEIWEKFRRLSEPELREYIQKNCPEWDQTVRGKGRKYEDKESFPNQITIDAIGEQMGFSRDDIDNVKRSVEVALASRW